MTLEDVISKYQAIRNKYEELQKIMSSGQESIKNLNSAKVLIDHILNDLNKVDRKNINTKY